MKRLRNPRSSGVDSLAYYAAVAGIAVVGYRMALEGKLGKEMARAAADVWEALHPGKKYPGAAAPSVQLGQVKNAPASGPYKGVSGLAGSKVPLVLTDFDGVPVGYDVNADTILQLAAGGNRYKPGDIFFDHYSGQYQFIGGGQLVDMNSGVTFTVSQFVAE